MPPEHPRAETAATENAAARTTETQTTETQNAKTQTARIENAEAVAEQVFVALADPTRRAILSALATDGPATATDLAARLPISRQAIAKHLTLLSDAGLLSAEPGERRRVRHRVHSAPMRVAQQFLAALARDWDTPLAALTDHLDRAAQARDEGEDHV